jgi:hypothetical protein
MILPRLFDYAATDGTRRHEPSGYINYQEFKPWLRDEFLFRCVYCLFRERWYPAGSNVFSIDHLLPRSAQGGEELECDYTNLVYSCMTCNSLRGVSSLVLNPNLHAFHDHLKVDEGMGEIQGLSPLGDLTIEKLQLNHPRCIRQRRRSFVIFALKLKSPNDPEISELYKHEFGFPDDLPDLRKLRPPKGNRTNSEESCYFVLRERKVLPEVY